MVGVCIKLLGEERWGIVKPCGSSEQEHIVLNVIMSKIVEESLEARYKQEGKLYLKEAFPGHGDLSHDNTNTKYGENYSIWEAKKVIKE